MSLSRIGKMPIAIPAGVEVSVKDNVFTAKGKLGQLSQDFHGDVNVKIEDGFVIVEPAAIKEFLPSDTGATKLTFEPIKQCSPITVLLLLNPS